MQIKILFFALLIMSIIDQYKASCPDEAVDSTFGIIATYPADCWLGLYGESMCFLNKFL